MSTRAFLFGISFLTCPAAARGQTLDGAEVRIPYAELKQLLAKAESTAKPVAPKPALLAARLRISVESGRPVVDGTFRTASFDDAPALIPLAAGDLSLETQEPDDAVILAEGNSLCLAVDRAGVQLTRLRLAPVSGEDGFQIALPACPSAIIETGDLPDGQSLVLVSGGKEQPLIAGQSLPLPHAAQSVRVRLLDSRETQEALRPPEPSNWTWQHQALVGPDDGGLVYQIIARATAAGGSGVEADLPLPADAMDVTVVGEDLSSWRRIRGENRASSLALIWKTRGLLDRQVTLSYRMPLRPLDRTWQLQAPGGEGTPTRFIIANSPVLSYAAEGLSAPLSPQGLPAHLAELLNGGTCQHLEAATSATLTVTPMPVAATADGVVSSAEWALKIEPDGAMLAAGVLGIDHKAPLDFIFDTPPGMKLLSCELAGDPVSPIDLGQGILKIALPATGGKSRLTCSFTGRSDALDPVEGTFSVALPRVPMFIHSLIWRIDLPATYQAETHGNLTRVQVASGEPVTRVTLKKNLCRDERPEIHVFYQRSDLNR